MNLAICRSCGGKGFKLDATGDESICEVCQGDGCVDCRPELPGPARAPCSEFASGTPAGWCIGTEPGCEKCARLCPDQCALWAEQVTRAAELSELEYLREVEDCRAAGRPVPKRKTR